MTMMMIAMLFVIMMTTMTRFRKEDSEHDVGGDVVPVGFFSNRSLSGKDN